MKLNKFPIAIMLLLVFEGCGKEPTVIPTVSTNPVSSIDAESGVSGGEITSNGHGEIISKGVIWGTSTTLTVNLSTRTNEGGGAGSFTSNISGLEPSTTYYVKAYATNSAGTGYGDPVEFQTTVLTVTDADNNVYETVKIGSQYWMKENLKTTKYNDGTEIPLDPGTSEILTTPAYAYYDNDKDTYGDVYGAMYNFYVVETGKLCPEGWHVPTVDDYNTMYKYFDVSFNFGGELKETGTEHWKAPNGGATNSTGFTALPGGEKSEVGSSYLTQLGYWWLSSSNVFGLRYDYPTVSFGAGSPELEISVRCIKD